MLCIHVLQVERYAVDIWNAVVKKQAGRHVTVLANAKCKLEVKCYEPCRNGSTCLDLVDDCK